MDSYKFPFKQLNEFLDNGLDKKLDEFYASYENEVLGHRIINIDKNKKRILFKKDSYGTGETEHISFTFEEYIKIDFLDMVYRSINTIAEGLKIIFISNQSAFLYLDSLERQLKILYQNKKLLAYPYLSLHLNLLAKEINSYKSLSGVKQVDDSNLKSPFNPKPQLKKSFFYELHNFSIRYDLISINFPVEDFLEVFCSFKTEKKIKFICNNSIMVLFLMRIETCFKNLNRKSIGESKRFKTSQNNLLSTSIFDTSKNRLKQNKDIDKDLLSDLDKLLVKYT